MKPLDSAKLTILAILLAGCAAGQPKIWNKPGGTAEQFGRDQMQCRQYGMQSAMANGLAGNMFVEIWISQETERCLQGLGYSVATGSSASR